MEKFGESVQASLTQRINLVLKPVLVTSMCDEGV